MRKGSLIDDVNIYNVRSFKGPAIYFPNQDIRRLFRLANAGKSDIFYDLGCGWGQNLIIALTEFNVKRAVGFEIDKARRQKAEQRLKKWSSKWNDITRDRWQIVPHSFDKALRDPSIFPSLTEATIIYFVTTSPEIIEGIEKA
jgi:Histone methylation protein DOT1